MDRDEEDAIARAREILARRRRHPTSADPALNAALGGALDESTEQQGPTPEVNRAVQSTKREAIAEQMHSNRTYAASCRIGSIAAAAAEVIYGVVDDLPPLGVGTATTVTLVLGYLGYRHFRARAVRYAQALHPAFHSDAQL